MTFELVVCGRHILKVKRLFKTLRKIYLLLYRLISSFLEAPRWYFAPWHPSTHSFSTRVLYFLKLENTAKLSPNEYTCATTVTGRSVNGKVGITLALISKNCRKHPAPYKTCRKIITIINHTFFSNGVSEVMQAIIIKYQVRKSPNRQSDLRLVLFITKR